MIGIGVPLDGLKQLFKISADWEIGILGWFVGSLDVELCSSFIVGDIALSNWFWVWERVPLSLN